MNFKIDNNSKVALYKQIIMSVKDAIRNDAVEDGHPMPSLNELAAMTGISMETAKKAYNILKAEGILSGRQGKGYFINVRKNGAPIKILMLVDKLSAYKVAIHQGLTETLKVPYDITISIHNQNISLFENIINESVGEYDYYLVAAHFHKNVKTSRIVKAIKKIPNNRLILIDNNIPEVKGNIGRVYQDFENDAAQALECGIDLVKKYRKVIILSTDNSLYGEIIIPGIRKLFKSYGIKHKVEKIFEPSMMVPGTLFIVLCGQLDTDHFTMLREATANGYKLGEDIGIISYNDEPVNEFICGGLSCISCDFFKIGRYSAEMINQGKMEPRHAPFHLIARATA